MSAGPGQWTVTKLHRALEEFEVDLRNAGLVESSVRTYVDRSRYFIRWLDGDYSPRGPNRERSTRARRSRG